MQHLEVSRPELPRTAEPHSQDHKPDFPEHQNNSYQRKSCTTSLQDLCKLHLSARNCTRPKPVSADRIAPTPRDTNLPDLDTPPGQGVPANVLHNLSNCEKLNAKTRLCRQHRNSQDHKPASQGNAPGTSLQDLCKLHLSAQIERPKPVSADRIAPTPRDTNLPDLDTPPGQQVPVNVLDNLSAGSLRETERPEPVSVDSRAPLTNLPALGNPPAPRTAAGSQCPGQSPGCFAQELDMEVSGP